jgi:hypothetical protein
VTDAATGVTTRLTSWIAVKWFVPFYRRRTRSPPMNIWNNGSTRWARNYAVLCSLLMQFARIAIGCFHRRGVSSTTVSEILGDRLAPLANALHMLAVAMFNVCEFELP